MESGKYVVKAKALEEEVIEEFQIVGKEKSTNPTDSMKPIDSPNTDITSKENKKNLDKIKKVSIESVRLSMVTYFISDDF